jgi:hypothetical protein
MSCHYKKQTPTRLPATPSSPTLRKKMTTVMMKVLQIICIITMLMFPPLALIALLHSNKWPLLVWLSSDSFQLVESAKADANVMGLIVKVGNDKPVTDNGRGYCNCMRITKPLNSPSDFDKTELTVVPKCPSILQLRYPAVSTALTKDFKFIEAQMEVEIMDSAEHNAGFLLNLKERIIVQGTYLAKSEFAIKTKFIILPIDPSSGRQYTCHNFDWQGATHADTNNGEVYLRS